MAGILDQLFGTQQPQDQGGLAQSILSQRFQPSPEDVGQSSVQSVIGNIPTPAQAMQARLTPGLTLQQQQTALSSADLNNQVLQQRMQYIQQRMQGANGQSMPQMPFQAQQQGVGQQSAYAQPVGFPANQNTPDQAVTDAMIFSPEKLPDVEMQAYNANPQVIQQKKTAETVGTDIANSQKGVVGIDSRLQNAINILNDQIKLAPQTVSGSGGKYLIGAERNLSNFGIKFNTPTAQTLFEQNNANLFTQEIPAIMSGMPGSRMDIPLINAIKQASSINENGTTEEKIASAQNLKNLLMKYQKNTHNYATQMGAQNTPIPSVTDTNPPQGQSSAPQGWTDQEWDALTPEEKAQLK